MMVMMMMVMMMMMVDDDDFYIANSISAAPPAHLKFAWAPEFRVTTTRSESSSPEGALC